MRAGPPEAPRRRRRPSPAEYPRAEKSCAREVSPQIVPAGAPDAEKRESAFEAINRSAFRDALYPGTTAVRANLTTQFATGVGSDVVLGIENLSGSSVRDQFTGNGGRNVLSGLGGNDVLDVRDGLSGNDKVDGGAGASDTCRRDAGDTMLNCP